MRPWSDRIALVTLLLSIAALGAGGLVFGAMLAFDGSWSQDSLRLQQMVFAALLLAELTWGMYLCRRGLRHRWMFAIPLGLLGFGVLGALVYSLVHRPGGIERSGVDGQVDWFWVWAVLWLAFGGLAAWVSTTGPDRGVRGWLARIPALAFFVGSLMLSLYAVPGISRVPLTVAASCAAGVALLARRIDPGVPVALFIVFCFALNAVAHLGKSIFFFPVLVLAVVAVGARRPAPLPADHEAVLSVR